MARFDDLRVMKLMAGCWMFVAVFYGASFVAHPRPGAALITIGAAGFSYLRFTDRPKGL
jgi:hypothetical protein